MPTPYLDTKILVTAFNLKGNKEKFGSHRTGDREFVVPNFFETCGSCDLNSQFLCPYMAEVLEGFLNVDTGNPALTLRAYPDLELHQRYNAELQGLREVGENVCES